MSTEIELTKPITPSSNGKPDSAPLSVLAEEDSLQGRLQMKGDGHVLGNFSGEIDCDGELLIGANAHVTADIRALRIVIAGLVRGNVMATGRLKIAPSGRLEGDARVGALVVQEGGVHHGVIRVHPEGIPEQDEVVVPSDPVESRVEVAPPVNPLNNSVDRVKRFWGELF